MLESLSGLFGTKTKEAKLALRQIPPGESLECDRNEMPLGTQKRYGELAFFFPGKDPIAYAQNCTESADHPSRFIIYHFAVRPAELCRIGIGTKCIKLLKEHLGAGGFTEILFQEQYGQEAHKAFFAKIGCTFVDSEPNQTGWLLPL